MVLDLVARAGSEALSSRIVFIRAGAVVATAAVTLRPVMEPRRAPRRERRPEPDTATAGGRPVSVLSDRVRWAARVRVWASTVAGGRA